MYYLSVFLTTGTFRCLKKNWIYNLKGHQISFYISTHIMFLFEFEITLIFKKSTYSHMFDEYYIALLTK